MPVLPAASAPRERSNAAALDFATSARSDQEFERARRHTSRVRFLKIALPAGGMATLLLLVAVFLGSKLALPEISIEGTTIEEGKLVMSSPRLTGADERNRPYTLTAERAVQDADRPTRITLEGIVAKLPVDDSDFADITAGNGVYDADAKTLDLGGMVSVDMANGMAIRLQDAAIDIENGRLQTQSPVSVDTGRAKVTSDSLTVEDRGKKIVFENRVRMTLLPMDEAQESQ